jgi:hypothetical protein
MVWPLTVTVDLQAEIAKVVKENLEAWKTSLENAPTAIVSKAIQPIAQNQMTTENYPKLCPYCDKWSAAAPDLHADDCPVIEASGLIAEGLLKGNMLDGGPAMGLIAEVPEYYDDIDETWDDETEDETVDELEEEMMNVTSANDGLTMKLNGVPLKGVVMDVNGKLYVGGKELGVIKDVAITTAHAQDMLTTSTYGSTAVGYDMVTTTGTSTSSNVISSVPFNLVLCQNCQTAYNPQYQHFCNVWKEPTVVEQKIIDKLTSLESLMQQLLEVWKA